MLSVYPPPPHTIHPPHQIATILEETSEDRIHYHNVVSSQHGIIVA